MVAEIHPHFIYFFKVLGAAYAEQQIVFPASLWENRSNGTPLFLLMETTVFLLMNQTVLHCFVSYSLSR